MGIKELQQEILDIAKKEADSIIADGKAESKRTAELAEKEVKSYRDNLTVQREKSVKDYEKKQSASSNFGIKRNQFNMEKRSLDKVRSKVVESLKKLDSSKRRQHISRMLNDAEKRMAIGKVYGSKKDLGLIKKYPTEEGQMIGGLIVANSDDSIRIDYSYDNILREVFDKNLSEISRILFKM